MPTYSKPKTGSAVWSGAVNVPGGVVDGLDCVKQRVWVVINSPIGSDPLRPFFGTNLYKWNDKGVSVAAAQIKREIIEAISVWVPEVTLGKISYKIAAGVVAFSLNLSYNGIDFGLSFGSNEMDGIVIIDAPVPYNNSGALYNMTLVINGTTLTPVGGGFVSVSDMVAHYSGGSSWGIYGDWGYGEDVVVLYGNSGVKSGVMNIVLV